MQLSGIPAKFPIVWANGASGANIRTIPQGSQINIQPGAASLTDGYPPLCFSPLAAGGVAPFGADTNGILKQITQWNQWHQAGGAPVPYDSAFQTAIGGYPQGAIVASATTLGLAWLSIVDNNLTNPDTGGAGWIQPWPSTGQTMLRATSEVIPGWVIGNATTIGNASSGASQLADASAKNLFIWHWNNFSNTQCPVGNPGGARGASALIDFNNNRTIQVLDYRGTSIVGVDTMQGAATTRLSGVPITSGSATAPGSVLGENVHTLLSTELPTVTPTFTGTQQTWNLNQTLVQNTGANTVPLTTSFALNGINASVTVTPAGTITTIGSGSSHNTVSRAMTHTMYLKL